MLRFLKERLRRQLTHGVREAIASLRNELKLQMRHRVGVRKAQRHKTSQFLQLNLGCGPNYKPGWVNIDLFDSTADLMLDLREPLPFADGSVVRRAFLVSLRGEPLTRGVPARARGRWRIRGRRA